MEILRSHEPRIQNDPFTHSSLRSVCMHGGFIFGDHTTGSYVASLTATGATYWLTGSSTPCIAVFKPYWLTDIPNQLVFPEAKQNDSLAFWHLRERLHRLVLENRVPNLQEYISQRDALEKEFLRRAVAVNCTPSNTEELHAIMESAVEQETALVTKTINESQGKKAKIRGNPYYRWYWRKQTRKLGS